MALKTIFRTALTVSDDPNETDTLGDIRQERTKRYKYVKFITTNVVAGDVVKYADTAGYDASNVLPTTSATEIVAGVVMATQTAATASSYGWIQIGGRSGSLAVNMTDTPLVGSDVEGSGTTKAFRKSITLKQRAGTALDVTASANVVLLRCVD